MKKEPIYHFPIAPNKNGGKTMLKKSLHEFEVLVEIRDRFTHLCVTKFLSTVVK